MMAVDNGKIYCVSYPRFADVDKRLVAAVSRFHTGMNSGGAVDG